jgi:hypothetical protein
VPNDLELASLRNPLWVDPTLTPILEDMLACDSPAYRDAATLAGRALQAASLLGIQTSSRRFLITLRSFRARPVAATSGALFQCLEKRSPPTQDLDLPGWIVVQDGYGGGKLVMVHELSHFANRLEVWRLHRDPLPPQNVASRFSHIVATVRARLLDEIAARHVAFLADTHVNPEDSSQPWPEPGALFACAVKIASYPEIYGDPGYVASVTEKGGRDALRDLVGAWFPALKRFRFYSQGSRRADLHARWLDEECRVASKGREAPDVPAEGTL